MHDLSVSDLVVAHLDNDLQSFIAKSCFLPNHVGFSPRLWCIVRKMDAHALLTSQGWRGSGHSLHPSSDTTGLRRPLLVSKKQNVLGVGKKQHRTSDMWWQNAFDSSLKGLDTSKEGEVVQTVTNGGLDMAKKGGGRFVGSEGRYACFVRGEGLLGTMKAEERTSEDSVIKKNHREQNDKRRNDETETKEERRARKAARRAARQNPEAEQSME